MTNTIKIINKNQIKLTFKNKSYIVLTKIPYVKEVNKYYKYNNEYYA
tara:strand:+ start:1415 stop:1555 length:141 start_codon:yes stop_codon:yes gene_type:complete